MWTMIVAASVVQLGSGGQQASPSGSDAWAELQTAYQEAVVAYVMEFAATFRQDVNGKPPDSPAGEYWSRFEAFAAEGDGRACLWQLQNVNAAPADGVTPAQRMATLFARFQTGPEGPWTADAIPLLVTARESLDREALTAFLDPLAGSDRPVPVRRAARLGLSRIASEQDPQDAFTLGLYAFAEEGENFVPAELSESELDAFAQRIEEVLREDDAKHFEQWYIATDDGYFGKPGAPPGPDALYRPLLEQLASAGSPRACVWYVGNTWAQNEAATQRMRECLDVICDAELDEEMQVQFAWRVSSLISQLGATLVEPRIRALIERSTEKARAGLLYSLGEGLCEAAGEDGSMRERGLAALGEVAERWPESDEAKRAQGKVFRFTNLLIGKPVPDFETSDVDGHAFRLSDYKGKVTVIDFWGFW